MSLKLQLRELASRSERVVEFARGDNFRRVINIAELRSARIGLAGTHGRPAVSIPRRAVARGEAKAVDQAAWLKAMRPKNVEPTGQTMEIGGRTWREVTGDWPTRSASGEQVIRRPDTFYSPEKRGFSVIGQRVIELSSAIMQKHLLRAKLRQLVNKARVYGRTPDNVGEIKKGWGQYDAMKARAFAAQVFALRELAARSERVVELARGDYAIPAIFVRRASWARSEMF